LIRIFWNFLQDCTCDEDDTLSALETNADRHRCNDADADADAALAMSIADIKVER